MAADDADGALLVLVGANPAESVAGVLAARGIGSGRASHASGHGAAQPSEAVVSDTTRLAPAPRRATPPVPSSGHRRVRTSVTLSAVVHAGATGAGVPGRPADFFEAQRRERIRARLLIGSIFVFLWLLANWPFWLTYSERTCDPATPWVCEEHFVFNVRTALLTAVAVGGYLAVAHWRAKRWAVVGQPCYRVTARPAAQRRRGDGARRRHLDASVLHR